MAEPLFATLYRRDFSKPLLVPFELRATNPVSWHVIGGPETAKVAAAGMPEALMQALGWLRCPVRLGDTVDRAVWWGYVTEVRVYAGSIERMVRLDEYANRVAVRYRYRDPLTGETSDEVSEFADAQNLTAIAEYGVKEWLEEVETATKSVAAQKAQTVLAARLQFPRGLEVSDRTDQARLEMDCVGWWQTLAWKHYRYLHGLEHNEEGRASIKVGQPSVTADTIGLLAVEDENYLYHLGAALPAFSADDRLRVTGSLVNDGRYTVTEGVSEGEARTETSSAIGFRSVRDAHHIFDLGGGLQGFEVGEIIEASGSDLNNRAFRVEENLKQPYRSYTNNTFAFYADDATPSIHETNSNWLNELDVKAGDVLKVSGANEAANNGYALVTYVDPVGRYVIVDAGLVTEGAAAMVTIEIGNTLVVHEHSTTDELPGDPITIRAGHHLMVEEAVLNEASGESITVGPYAEKLAQSFLVHGSLGWNVGRVMLRARRTGGMDTDPLRISLHADSEGTPGTLLGSEALEWDAFSPNMERVEVDFAGAIALSPEPTLYHLVIEKEGDPDVANTYEIEIDEDAQYGDTSADQKLLVSRGGVWSDYAIAADEEDFPEADLVFGITGTLPVTTLLQEVLVGTGQFFTGLEMPNVAMAQGEVYQPEYVDGRKLVEELLGIGTVNHRRLLARVTEDRRVVVAEEPVPGTSDYLLNLDGTLEDAKGNAVLAHLGTVGVWVRLKGGLDDERLFLESVEYDPETGEVRREWKGLPAPWEVL